MFTASICVASFCSSKVSCRKMYIRYTEVTQELHLPITLWHIFCSIQTVTIYICKFIMYCTLAEPNSSTASFWTAVVSEKTNKLLSQLIWVVLEINLQELQLLLSGRLTTFMKSFQLIEVVSFLIWKKSPVVSKHILQKVKKKTHNEEHYLHFFFFLSSTAGDLKISFKFIQTPLA